MKYRLELRQQIMRCLGVMDTERSSWVPHWEELSNFILPRRGRFLGKTQAKKGEKINQRIVDGTGTRAARTFRAGMMSGLTSPARPWFRLSMRGISGPLSQNVKLWLADVEQRMMTVMAQSNFYNALATLYEELGVFGTGVMIIDEDNEDVIRCYTLTVGEYYLALSYRLAPEVLIREFKMTVAQLVNRFGLENCSQSVRDAYKLGTHGTEIDVVHEIGPNREYTEGAIYHFGKQWRCIYFEKGGVADEYLEIKGYDYKPFIATRWDVTGNDPYGRSVGMDALPDIRQLQVMVKRKAQAVDKMTNPPLKAPPSLQNKVISALPGGVTFVADASGDQAKFGAVYTVNPQVGELREDIREQQGAVKETFYVDLFMAITDMDGIQPRNNAEIYERKEEKLLQLGPALERQQDELLDPAIDVVFHIMAMAGLFPSAPEEIQKQPLQVQYISVLAQAQKATGTTSIERTLTLVGSIAGTRPDALDKIDYDAAIDEYTDLIGVAPKIVVSNDVVAKVRAQRAQQQAAQAQAQQAMAAVQGAKLLSETDVGGGQNALQRVIGS